MKTIRRPVMAAFLLCGLPLALSATLPAQAQRHGEERHERRAYKQAEVSELVQNVRKDSKTFRVAYEKADRKGNLPNGENSQLKERIQRLDEFTARLRTNFNNSNDWHTCKKDVENVLNRARTVNLTVSSRPRLKEMFRPEWMKVRNELNRLAEAYNLSPLT